MILYVNSYFIVTPKGYTKHYYNGSNRLAAVVGNIEDLPDGMIVANASERLDNDSSKAYMHSFVSEDTLLNVQMNCEKDMLLPVLSKTATGDAGGSPATNYVLKDNTYYYHGDHLGSCSWITDGNGDIIEHRRYLPYGETWYEKRFNESDYTERYKFTGKEKDEESGYYYFGARYIDPTLLTSWLSVDKKAGDYPNWMPYHYCLGNPINSIDPDGNGVFPNKEALRAAAETVMPMEKYQPGYNGTTHCNEGANAINNMAGDNSFDGMLANDMGAYLRNPNNATQLTQQEASDYANEGAVVFASSLGTPNGHVAVVAPRDKLNYSTNYGEEVVSIFNIGIENKEMKLSGGFSKERNVQLFILNADKNKVDRRTTYKGPDLPEITVIGKMPKQKVEYLKVDPIKVDANINL